MTTEQAIKYIILHCNPDYPKGKTEWETAINMAIKALEKQLPMHPAQSKEPRCGMGYDYYDYVCPTCGSLLCFEPQIRDFKKLGTSRCNHCSQLINWTEVEE